MTGRVFSAKSAGMVMRRAAFYEAGVFDDDYFIYVEESDLAAERLPYRL